MSLSELDLALRFAAIGLLCLCIFILWLRLRCALGYGLIASALGLTGYLLLTAPLGLGHHPLSRPILLLLTDCLGFAVWFSALEAFNTRIRFSYWPQWLRIAAGLFSAWHALFFLVFKGQGIYHDLSHALEIIAAIHVCILALVGFENELSSQHRKVRIAVALYTGAIITALALNEFIEVVPVRSPWPSVVIAGIIASSVMAALVYFLCSALPKLNQTHAGRAQTRPSQTNESELALPLDMLRFDEKLRGLIKAGALFETGLSISSLAQTLACSEARLRELINRHHGHRNFNQFLNEHRVDEAKQRLLNPSLASLPILSIALDLGYASIGPFNRAFKEITGKTPSDFRKTGA